MSTAVATTIKDLRTYLEDPRVIRGLSDVAAKGLDPRRLAKLLISSAGKMPDLLKCEKSTIANSLILCSTLGLEPNTPQGECYIVPRFNKRAGRYEAGFQLGYRGALKLVREGEQVAGIDVRLVHVEDDFALDFGLDRQLKHHPHKAVTDPGHCLGGYMIARWRDGGEPQMEWMTTGEIEAIRTRSSAGDCGPWVTDWAEMAKKTVFKRGAKWIGFANPKLAQAIAGDNAAEAGEDLGDIIDVQPEGDPPPPTKTEKLKKDLKDKAPPRPAAGHVPPHGGLDYVPRETPPRPVAPAAAATAPAAVADPLAALRAEVTARAERRFGKGLQGFNEAYRIKVGEWKTTPEKRLAEILADLDGFAEEPPKQ